MPVSVNSYDTFNVTFEDNELYPLELSRGDDPHLSRGCHVDEIWISNGDASVKIAFDDSTAIDAGTYFLIPANAVMGPINIKVKNYIYLKKNDVGAGTISILCTRNNRY